MRNPILLRVAVLIVSSGLAILLMSCDWQKQTRIQAANSALTSQEISELRLKLQSRGVNVRVGSDGSLWVLVANLRGNDFQKILPALEAAQIHFTAKISRNLCGVDVRIENYYRAAEILAKEKKKLGIAMSIWDRDNE
jgi:hypothetical protein